jgi:hypothetical protein
MARSVHFAWKKLRMSMALHACAQHLGMALEAEVLARWAEEATGQGRGSQRVARWRAMLEGLAHSDVVLHLVGQHCPPLVALLGHPLWRALGFGRVTRQDIRRWLPLTAVPTRKACRLIGLPCTRGLDRMAWLLLWLRVSPPVNPLLQVLLSRALKRELPRLCVEPLWNRCRHGLNRLLRDRLPTKLGDLAGYATEQALDDSVRFWSLLRAWGMGTPLFHNETEWCQFCDVCGRLSMQELRQVFLQLSVFDREHESIFEVSILRRLYQKLYRWRRAAADGSTAQPA